MEYLVYYFCHCILTYLSNNSVQHSYSWEAGSHSAHQEISFSNWTVICISIASHACYIHPSSFTQLWSLYSMWQMYKLLNFPLLIFFVSLVTSLALRLDILITPTSLSLCWKERRSVILFTSGNNAALIYNTKSKRILPYVYTGVE